VRDNNSYQKLSELATNEQDRQIIMRIQGDEARHYHWFTMILRRLGGPGKNLKRGKIGVCVVELRGWADLRPRTNSICLCQL